MFVPVNHYFEHMMNKKLGDWKPLFHGFNQYGSTTGIVIDRQDQFQTELFIVPEGIELIEFHVHPNVDSIEIPLAGDFTFTSNGVDFRNAEKPERLFDKSPAWVDSESIHGATWRSGGAFLSFQYWKNGVKPTSVIKDFLLDPTQVIHTLGLKGLPQEVFSKLPIMNKFDCK